MRAKNHIIMGIIIFIFSLLGCTRSDFAKKLPNGYELISTNQYTVMIWTSRSGADRNCIVPPKIVELGVTKDYVFGWTEASPRADKVALAKPGYFLLNTSNGEVFLGLEEGSWKKKLKEIGIDKPFTLLKNPQKFK